MKKYLLICMAFFSINAMAQAPEGINYQAVVRDLAGATITNAPVGLKLALLQSSATGTVVYEESFSTFSNDFGLVNVVLGQGTVINGSFANIDWSSGPYFIEVAADITGGTSYAVLGTQELMSVPYALYAKSAENTFSGDYNDLTNQPTIPTATSQLTNDTGFITSPDDADADPTNELQTLSVSGDSLTLSDGGGTIVMPGAVKVDTGGFVGMCVGNSTPGVGWVVYNATTISIDVSTAGCAFASTPQYFSSIGGVGSHFELTGASAIYTPTANGFTVYIKKNDGSGVTPADAVSGGWSINWQGIGN
ncbi:MAG: hypothetical protein AB8B56_18015 [Crocinitomicaceae bacterium]